MNVCLFVCLYVWNLYKFTFLNRSEPNLAHVSSLDPRFLTSLTFWALYLWGPLQNHGHKRAVGATVFRDNPYIRDSSFYMTSPTLRCRKSWSHPRQPYIRDSSGSTSNVAEMTSLQTTDSSAKASYPLFWQVFASCHRYYVQLDDGAIRHSVISFILAPVSVTYGKSRPCRRQLRVPTPSVLHSR
jgi:hypothetical protein